MYLWLCWVSLLRRLHSSCDEWGLVGVWGPLSVLASRCGTGPLLGFSSRSSRGSWTLSTGSAVVADGLRHAAACGVFTAQGLSSWLLHWQMDSLPLSRQEAQFFENPPYCFHIDYQFTFPPTAHQGSLFSTPSPAFVICVIFYNGLFCLIYVLIDLSPWFPPPPPGGKANPSISLHLKM